MATKFLEKGRCVMKSLIKNKSQHVPFALLRRGVKKKLCINFKKLLPATIMLLVFSSILFATDAFAADAAKECGSDGGLFSHLACTGGKIFSGMREIIYAVSGFGIIAIVIGSIFGNINWKWLTAIIIGLFVIAATAAIVNYMVGETTITPDMITDSLITGE